MLKSPIAQSAGRAPSPVPAGRRRGVPDSAIMLLQTNSLSMLVQRELERRILAGDLAAGAKLNEAAIAAHLDRALSSTPGQSVSRERA